MVEVIVFCLLKQLESIMTYSNDVEFIPYEGILPEGSRTTGYWIHGKKVYDVQFTHHIGLILEEPQLFGWDKDYVRDIFKKYDEKLNVEGQAREELIKQAASDGWIRVRHYQKPDYWSIGCDSSRRRVKDIQNFIFWALDKGVMSNHDSIVILGYDNPEIDKEVFSFQNGGVKAYLMQERIAFKESVQKEESMVYILGENVNTRVKSALVGKNPDVYTIGIVTFDNPMLGWKKDETYESQRNSFKVTLKSGSIKYVPLSYGTFGKKEDSFILFNINKETVEFLAKKFYQKSFIFGEKNKDIISYTLYECDEEKYIVL
jgi:hypothetical protein